jgi:hypothetical protein
MDGLSRCVPRFVFAQRRLNGEQYGILHQLACIVQAERDEMMDALARIFAKSIGGPGSCLRGQWVTSEWQATGRGISLTARRLWPEALWEECPCHQPP